MIDVEICNYRDKIVVKKWMIVYKIVENLYSRLCGMVLIFRIYEKYKILNIRIISFINKWLKWIK